MKEAVRNDIQAQAWKTMSKAAQARVYQKRFPKVLSKHLLNLPAKARTEANKLAKLYINGDYDTILQHQATIQATPSSAAPAA